MALGGLWLPAGQSSAACDAPAGIPLPRSLQLHPASAGVHSRRFFIGFMIRVFVVQMVLGCCFVLDDYVPDGFTAYRFTTTGKFLIVA